jgi:hypothetical protein
MVFPWYSINFFYCAGWGYVVAFTIILQYIKYIILEFTLSIILLYSSPSHHS